VEGVGAVAVGAECEVGSVETVFVAASVDCAVADHSSAAAFRD